MNSQKTWQASEPVGAFDAPTISKPAFDLIHGGQCELPADSFGGDIGTGVFCSSPVFDRALKAINEDIRSRTGLIVLTGETGTGKSLLIRHVIESLDPDVTPILLIDPRLSFQNFLRFACRELNLAQPDSDAQTSTDKESEVLIEYLRAERKAGRSVAVFVDEAQEMSEDLLADLLRLSDSTATGDELLQIVLVGLPTLRESLRKPALRKLTLRKLTQRGLRLHKLQSLRRDQIEAFIRQRLDGAYGKSGALFTVEAIEKIGVYSRGIPRSINTICSLAMFTAQFEQRRSITGELIDDVGQRFLPAPAEPRDETAAAAALTDDATPKPSPSSAKANPSRTPELHVRLAQPVNPEIEQERIMSRLDSLNKILKKLQNESPGVEASALISEDGLMIASALPQEFDETHVGGMTATLLNLGTRAATELRRGEVQEVIVRGEHGYAVMISAGRGALLLVLANEHSKLGLIFFDMREAIKSVKTIL